VESTYARTYPASAQTPFVLRIPELLAEPWFKYLLLPVCGLLAGAVKGLYRKDDREWAKEDLPWGPTWLPLHE
jgi:hypothetical protein